MKDIAKHFKLVLDEYLKEKEKDYKGNYLAKHIRETIPYEIKKKYDNYIVTGSSGKGSWTYTPWIAIFNDKITKSAQKGYYIVYLFKEDMSGFYISLNQGYTFFKNNSKSEEEVHRYLKTLSDYWKDQLNIDISYRLNEIKLNATTDLGKGYEPGHICGKYYETGNFNSNELDFDLSKMLGYYDQLYNLMHGDSFEKINASILEDKFNDKYFINENNEIIETDRVKEEFNNLVEDQKYQQNINQNEPYTDKQLEEIRNKNKEIKKQKGKRTNNRYKTDFKLGKTALSRANFKCEIDPNHITFTSKSGMNNYVEAHHLIPMKYQEHQDFLIDNDIYINLDQLENIVSLCPVCHAKIHFGIKDEVKEMLMFLYEKRVNSLLTNDNIELDINDLFKYYGLV